MQHINKKGVKPTQPATPSRKTKIPAKFPNPNAPNDSGQAGRLAYSMQETAAALGVSLKTIANWIHTGRLRAAKIGGRVLIPASAIEDLLAGGDA